MTMEMIGVNVKVQQNANGMEIQLYEAALKSSDKWLRWSLGLVCVETTNWIQAQEYHCTVSQYIACCGAAARHAASFPYWSLQKKQLSKVWLDPNMSESFPLLEEDDI